MIEQIKKHLVGIAIGVRFRNNFKVEDRLGEMIDEIVYKKDSFFSPERFPTVLARGTDIKSLVNEKTGDSLTINLSNAVLELRIGEGLEAKDLQTVNDRFNAEIVRDILVKHGIAQINRIGYVNKYVFDSEQLVRRFVSCTAGRTLDGVRDVKVRFSKRFATPEGLTKKGVDDFENVIYDITKPIDEMKLLVSVDYQKYFRPPLEDARDLKFREFAEDVERYNSSNFVVWLKAISEPQSDE